MTDRRLTFGLVFVFVLGVLAYWISTRTYWADVQVPLPPKGEARTNPTYAAEHLVARLGATPKRDRLLVLPSSTGVIVLSAWNWNLSPSRRESLERWVESGGRLVLDASVGTTPEFERWSGIVTSANVSYLKVPPEDRTDDDKPCRQFQELRGGQPAGTADHWLCETRPALVQTSTRTAAWSLREKNAGVQAMRTTVGRGSVTRLNFTPFAYRDLFEGDHGWLLVAATQLKAGDEVHFLSEGDYPGLLTLTWQRGGPAVVLLLLVVGLQLWRGGVRFGPPIAPTVTARRSLAEQIRGSGQFALHNNGTDALHEATVRALDDVARRRIAGYRTMAAQERTATLAKLTGLGTDALADAIYHPQARRPQALHATIALIDTARRRLMLNLTRTSDVTD